MPELDDTCPECGHELDWSVGKWGAAGPYQDAQCSNCDTKFREWYSVSRHEISTTNHEAWEEFDIEEGAYAREQGKL